MESAHAQAAVPTARSADAEAVQTATELEPGHYANPDTPATANLSMPVVVPTGTEAGQLGLPSPHTRPELLIDRPLLGP